MMQLQNLRERNRRNAEEHENEPYIVYSNNVERESMFDYYLNALQHLEDKVRLLQEQMKKHKAYVRKIALLSSSLALPRKQQLHRYEQRLERLQEGQQIVYEQLLQIFAKRRRA